MVIEVPPLTDRERTPNDEYVGIWDPHGNPAAVMKLEGHAHTWRFPVQVAQGIPTAVKLRALHSLHFLGPEGADSVHPSRRGRRLGGGGLVVDGSTCSLVWERRTTTPRPAQPRALQCSCGRPLEARQQPADPCPPPPSSTERPFGCGALWATRAVAPQPVQPAPVAPRAGKHSLRPGAPPPARGTPSAVESRTQPAWQHHLCLRQSRSAGLTPVVPRTTAFPCQQAVVEWLGSMS